MNEYLIEVEVEVEGRLAMFADPETGSEAVSYPAPTFSAAKGIFESILFLKHAIVIPTKVHICSPTRFVEIGSSSTTTHARKSNLIAGNHALRMREMALRAPIFQLFACVKNGSDRSLNHAHSYQDQFNRRLKRGQSYRRPCLGRSDFPCTYVGELRPESIPCSVVNHHLPSFLHHPFDCDQNGKVGRRDVQNVMIESGVLNYA